MHAPFLLSRALMRRIEAFFPLSHGIPRVGDRQIVLGIVYIIKHGLMWHDAPKDNGPHKTIYNGFIHWSRLAYSTTYSPNWLARRANAKVIICNLRKKLQPGVEIIARRNEGYELRRGE